MKPIWFEKNKKTQKVKRIVDYHKVTCFFEKKLHRKNEQQAFYSALTVDECLNL